MYVRASSEEMKKKVLASFMTAGSKLQIIVATIAFSMGTDCPDIQNIVHYGPLLIKSNISKKLDELEE